MQSSRPLLLLALLLASWAAARPASACGGTFCDTGPRAMPVDQKGENVLFVVSQGQVEAHIQIQYKGDAARFAWVLPLPAIPEIEVGSEALFQNLLAATVPRFSVNAIGCGNSGLVIGGGGRAATVDGGGGGTTVVA